MWLLIYSTCKPPNCMRTQDFRQLLYPDWEVLRLMLRVGMCRAMDPVMTTPEVSRCQDS